MSIRTKHIIGVVLTVACGFAVEAFGRGGPWAHVGSAGLVVALATQLKTALGDAS